MLAWIAFNIPYITNSRYIDFNIADDFKPREY